jgi:hypothetical protein
MTEAASRICSIVTPVMSSLEQDRIGSIQADP